MLVSSHGRVQGHTSVEQHLAISTLIVSDTAIAVGAINGARVAFPTAAPRQGRSAVFFRSARSCVATEGVSAEQAPAFEFLPFVAF